MQAGTWVPPGPRDAAAWTDGPGDVRTVVRLSAARGSAVRTGPDVGSAP